MLNKLKHCNYNFEVHVTRNAPQLCFTVRLARTAGRRRTGLAIP
jgi:hypothetical protein